MATNIFPTPKEPRWPNTTMPTVSAGGGRQPMFPHWQMRVQWGTSTGMYFPGFSDDAAAGSTIKITFEATYGRYITRLDYFDKDGTAITDGVWNGGFTYAEVTDAEAIAGYMMDEVDECLYFLAVNTDTSPHQWKLCSVDKEGVVSEGNSWQDPSGTSFDIPAANARYLYMGTLSRTGADQDGDFVFQHTGAQIGVDGIGSPYRGAIMTFAASDGALTESNLCEADTGLGGYIFYHMGFGPTSNNIWMGLAYSAGKDISPQISMLNATTNMGYTSVYMPLDAGSTPQNWVAEPTNIMRWRGYYCVPASGGQQYSPMWYTVADMHNYIDELGVKFGIL